MAAFPYWRLSGFYFCYFSLLGATAPFFALYFAHLGFPAARIGELVAIPMLMRCIAPNLWGWLGDRSGRRLAIVRLGALCTLASFSLILLDQSYAWLALVMALHAFFWHAVLPQFEVLTLNHLRERVASYGRVRLWGSVGFIVTVVALGRLFDALSLASYPYALLLIMLAILVASAWIPDAAPRPGEADAPAGGLLGELGKPGVLAFYGCVALMQLSHGPYYSFMSIHLEAQGYSRGTIGQLWALGVIAEILLFMAMPRLLARFSLRAVLAASFLLAALRWVLLGFFAAELPLLLFAQLLHAATFGAFHAAAIHFVRHSFSPRHQGQGQALYAALAGTGGALGAFYAGHVWNLLGAGWTFAGGSLAVLLAAAIIVTRLNPEHGHERLA